MAQPGHMRKATIGREVGSDKASLGDEIHWNKQWIWCFCCHAASLINTKIVTCCQRCTMFFHIVLLDRDYLV